MNAAIGKAHPNVFELIKCLKDEQEMTQVTTVNATRRIYRKKEGRRPDSLKASWPLAPETLTNISLECADTWAAGSFKK